MNIYPHLFTFSFFYTFYSAYFSNEQMYNILLDITTCKKYIFIDFFLSNYSEKYFHFEMMEPLNINILAYTSNMPS